MQKESIFISEIKASCKNPDRIREILKEYKADFKGIDHQIDTYFKVDLGRLKLRRGNIENSLIYYNRIEAKGIKSSSVELVRLQENQVMDTHRLLEKLHGQLVEVDKTREIYFIKNVKFHIDKVVDLGDFIEIEAINSGAESKDVLEQQCTHYCKLFNLQTTQYIDCSYSDLLVKLKN